MTEGRTRRTAGTVPVAPIFFTSYDERAVDGDRVEDFHNALLRDVRIYMAEHARPTAFLSRHIIPGRPWEKELMTACCTAKVLLAVLTDGYVISKWCSREWAIFEERGKRTAVAGAEPPPSILPVQWVPFRDRPPAAVRAVQNLAWLVIEDQSRARTYRDRGLLYLMRFDPEGFDLIVDNLARMVIDAADHDLPPLGPDDAARVVPSFGPLSVPTQPTHEPRVAESGAATQPETEPLPGGDNPPADLPAPGHSPQPAAQVAEVLGQVTAFDNFVTWQKFVAAVGRERQRRIDLGGESGDRHERAESLVHHLRRQHPDKDICHMLVHPLRAVAGGEVAAASIQAIVDSLPEEEG